MNVAEHAEPEPTTLGAVLDDRDALAAYRAPYGAWTSMHRAMGGPQRMIDRMAPILLVAIAVSILIAGGFDARHGLGIFVIIAATAPLLGALATGPARHAAQGGDAPRHLHVHGPWLVIVTANAQRWYDTRSCQTWRVDDWALLRDVRGRWLPDLLPAALLDTAREFGICASDVQAASPRERNATLILDHQGVILQATWRDTPARLLAAGATMSPMVGIALIVALGLLGAHVLDERIPPIGYILLAGWMGGMAIWLLNHLVEPLLDAMRGVRIDGRDYGVFAHDDGYVEGAGWASKPVTRVASDSLRLVRPLSACIGRGPSPDEAFEALNNRVRDHALGRQPGARSGVGRGPAIALQSALCALVVAGFIALGNVFVSMPASFRWIAAAWLLFYVGVPIIVGIGRAKLIRRPPATSVPRPRSTARLRPRVAAAAILIVPGAIVLAVVAPVYQRPDIATVALGVAVIGGLLLTLARDADAVGIRDRVTVIVTGVAACASVLLVNAWHVTHAEEFIFPALVVCVLAALLALAPSMRGGRDRSTETGIALGTMPIAVAVSLLIGGVVVHQLRDASAIDATAPEQALHSGLVRDITVNSMPITQAWRDSYQLDVSWHGDRSTVEPSAGVSNPADPFVGPRGKRALERMESLLDIAAAQPGPRPSVRRMIFSRSDASTRVHVALAGAGNSPVWPSYLVRTLDDSNALTPAANKRAASRSHYHRDRQQITFHREITTGLLDLLSTREGNEASDDAQRALGVFMHEAEHSMTSGRGDPRWVTEAVAEVVPSWYGMPETYAKAIGIQLPKTYFAYSKEYDQWAHTLTSVLAACGHPFWKKGEQTAAMRILREGTGTITGKLATCLRDSGASKLGHRRLSKQLHAAYDENRAEELIASLRAPDQANQ